MKWIIFERVFFNLLVIPSVHLTRLSCWFCQFRFSNLPDLGIFSIKNNYDDDDDNSGGDGCDDELDDINGDDIHSISTYLQLYCDTEF
jgi:hypothetical protein